MNVPQLEIAKSVVCYSLMIWCCFFYRIYLQRALYSFADACKTAGMKISTAKTEVLHLSINPGQCVLRVNGATLKQVEKLKYFGIAFTSDGRQDEELDSQFGEASAVMQALRYSVVKKRGSAPRLPIPLPSIFILHKIPTFVAPRKHPKKLHSSPLIKMTI